MMKQVRRFVEEYDVTTCSPGPSPHPEVTHVEILSDFSSPRGIVSRVLDEIAHRTEWFSRMYFRTPGVLQTLSLLDGRQFDAVIANDAETVGVACNLFGGERVHADLHEFFPDMGFEESALGKRHQRYWTWMTKSLVVQAHSSTTVGAQIAKRYHEYGFYPGVVTNSTHLRDLPFNPTGRIVRLVHSGNPFHERSLEQIMRAVAASPANVSFDLYLTWHPESERARFVALADELGDRITVHDPVSQGVLIETLNQYDLGVHILQPVSTNNLMALPNKFFDYVQARLGIIVGPSIEMAKLVHEWDLGIVTKDFGEAAIAESINSLTPEMADEFKHAAMRAAEPLSAERQVEVWAEAVAAIATRTRDAG
ncbi:glycosyltransferase family 1 protein [Microbacterium profundi]|uniref:glycosyltransferase family 1 protein n=1 Tax=Microbacterium profundi TaxID=450380 RepID=UPI001F24592A|nr:glycosyltransferase family 1 protein [Microbacterium profundi]MCE7480331.1 glycosyltransferase family 1 protein [Microbacterium profundi]